VALLRPGRQRKPFDVPALLGHWLRFWWSRWVCALCIYIYSMVSITMLFWCDMVLFGLMRFFFWNLTSLACSNSPTPAAQLIHYITLMCTKISCSAVRVLRVIHLSVPCFIWQTHRPTVCKVDLCWLYYHKNCDKKMPVGHSDMHLIRIVERFKSF
jgi:hypothetical protein